MLGKEEGGKASILTKFLIIYCMFRAVLGMDSKAREYTIRSFLLKGKQDFFFFPLKKKEEKKVKSFHLGETRLYL